MNITVNQTKQILNFFPTIPDLTRVFDSRVGYEYTDCLDRTHSYNDDGESFLTSQYDDSYMVTSIELMFQSGNMDDDDTIKEYMTKTLGICEDEFQVDLNMLNGNAWMKIVIR